MEAPTVMDFEARVRGVCEGFDPESVVLPDVVAVFRSLERMERLIAGAKLRLARRVDDARIAERAGRRSTAEWLAAETGTNVGSARAALDTSKRLADQPGVEQAVATGRLSNEQAKVVADAVAADPTAEQRLLAAARSLPVRELKDRCARTKANAHPDPKARREAIRRGRFLRTFRDAEGAWNLQARHLPEVGAEIEALLRPFFHQQFETARRCGAREPHDAYRADALVDLARAAHATSAVPKGARRAETKLFVHVDHHTLASGRVHDGTICEIDGVGPVDVDWVRSIYGEAFVVALVEDAVDVRAVVHLGRQVTAHQRSALEARGYVCEVPGCTVAHNLEIDHVDDWHHTRHTTLDELAWKCPHHHDLKTHHGYRLTGTHRARVWTAPTAPPSATLPPTAPATPAHPARTNPRSSPTPPPPDRGGGTGARLASAARQAIWPACRWDGPADRERDGT